MKKYRPLKELVLARTREFFREPEAIFWVYVFPILLMVGLGIAFPGQDEGEVRVRVAGASPGEVARVAVALKKRPVFSIVAAPLETARDQSSRRPWDLLVLAQDGKLTYVFDPAMPQGRSARWRVDSFLQEHAGRKDPVPTAVEALIKPGSRYVDWLIPGLLGLNIMGGGLWGVGFVTVDMRMRKLLKRFQATPMRRSDFLLALVGSRLLFLIPEMAAILLVGHLGFGLELRGSWLALGAVVLAGALSFSGLGLLIASRAQRIETISGLMNAVMLPMWIVSGVFFSAERFPGALQPFIQALPLTQLNNALRAVILDGAPLHAQWLPVALLVAWGGLSFPAAVRWFRWQ
jgi:ABC-type multidrug transport system permease subunit